MMKKPSLLLVFAALFALCGLPSPPAWAQLMNPSLQMPLGNPDGARASDSSPTKYLIQRPEYALSFNDSLHFPNWVAWHLAAADLGSASRSNNFKADTNLPTGFTVIKPSDYTRTGYDRGHNCPSADRTFADVNNAQVFYMTNITPQLHEMNAGPWQGLEDYCRTQISSGNREAMIYCGHGFSSANRTYIQSNDGSDGSPATPKIPVPDFGWKIVVIVPKLTSGEETSDANLLSRVTMRTRVIAVRMPNDATTSGMGWTKYITTVKAIESATGLVFFDKVPAKTAAVLKDKVDAGL